MSNSKTSGGDGGNQNKNRNLPSWMSSRDDEGSKKGKGRGKAHNGDAGKESGASTTGLDFSRLLEGVVFVLSGFVNPERSTLRSQALEMGAEYQPDWNSQCTLLICAFSNTPKFRQVEADCGTIVSKEWITECYAQKKLVDIEKYLMHPGKPWRRSKISNESTQDQKTPVPRKSNKPVDKGSHSEPSTSASIKCVTQKKVSNPAKECFSPSKLKKWAVDDLKGTISWLESQEEKPEPSELKNIAAEGILTCLQDAIDSLEQKQDVRQVTEQWSFVPRVVEELAKLDSTGKDSTPVLKDDLCRQAKACKRIYEAELSNVNDDSAINKKKLKTGYDSDETIEMTEEEIDIAYKTISSELCK